MNIKTKIILLSIIAIVSTACKVYTPQSIVDERLHIVNHSDRTIYAYYCLNDPDTTIIDNTTNNLVSFPIKQGNNQFFPRCIVLSKAEGWDAFFANKKENYRIHIFVFDANVFENVSWKEIKKEYLILKRYDLSYKDLQELKWDVVYEK
jgi:hypothetical protein